MEAGASTDRRDRESAGLIASHWFWLFALVAVVTAFDYWDHVSRAGSAFAAAPLAWLGFTAASTATLCALAWAVSWGLARVLARFSGRLRIPRLAADTAGVALAITAHLVATGPLWSALLWRQGMTFGAPGLPVLAGALTYLFYRGVFTFARQIFGRPRPAAPRRACRSSAFVAA